MKTRIVAITPLGKFIGITSELTKEEIKTIVDFTRDKLTTLSFETESGDHVILREDILNNSVILVQEFLV